MSLGSFGPPSLGRGDGRGGKFPKIKNQDAGAGAPSPNEGPTTVSARIFDSNPASLAALREKLGDEAARAVRHLELDLEFYRQRISDAGEERKELVQRIKELQEALAEAHRRLEEQEQRIRHQQIDLRQAQAGLVGNVLMVAEPSVPAPPAPGYFGHTAPAALGFGDAGDGGGGQAIGPIVPVGGTQGMGQRMEQMRAALEMAHAELHQERKMKEGLARRSKKCVEQLERMSSLVEQQRSEIQALKFRAVQAERLSEGRRWQLQEAARCSAPISEFLLQTGGFQQLANLGQLQQGPARNGKLQKLPALTGQKSAPQLKQLKG